MKNMFLLMVLFTSAFLSANDLEIAAPYAKSPPKIDGKLDDPCWKNLSWIDGFSILGTRTQPEAPTRFKIFHDSHNIYLAIKAEEPFMDKLSDTPISSEDSPTIWKHDSIELSLVPDIRGNFFYKLIVSSSGEFADMHCEDDNTGGNNFKVATEWNSHAKFKAVKNTDNWTVEIAIPLGTFDYDATFDGNWLFNLGRNRYAAKKTEHSSFSPIDCMSFAVPGQFAKLKLENFNFKFYDWKIASMTGKTVKDDNNLKYVSSMDVANNSGEFRIFQIQTELKDTFSNKIIADNCLSDLYLSDKKYNRLTVPMSVPSDISPDKNYTLSCLLTDRNGILLKQISSQVKIKYSPVALKIIKPPYRNNIYATMKDKEIEAEIILENANVKEILVELISTDGKVKFTKKIANSSCNKIKFDATDLEDGTYILHASAVSPGRKTVEKKIVIKKLPYLKGEVWLDKYGIAYVDGKIYLPFGWFNRIMNIPPEKGENTGQIYYTQWGDASFVKKMLTKADNLNLKLVFSPYKEKNNVNKWNIFSSQNRKGELTEEQKQLIIEAVNAIKENPAFLAWYMADEPECRYENPEWYKKACELLAEIDPYHPTIMLNTTSAGIEKYYEGCDILMPDCYPTFFENGKTIKPLYSISEMTRVAVALRPTWFAPQAFSWREDARIGSPGRPPTFDELRNQVYQVFANDGKGIILYQHTNMPMYTSLKVGGKFLASETDSVKDYLLAPNQKDALIVKTEPQDKNFQAALKILDGKICLVAVNTSKQEIRATFKTGLADMKKLYVLSEGREVELQNGCFSDSFKSEAVHVYLNNQSVAGNEQLSVTREEIETIKKAAFKSGNLAAVGELVPSMHKILNEKKASSELPIITVSSERHYATTGEKFGSSNIYFLLDGKIETEALCPITLWSPAQNAKPPYFLDIKLPRKAQIQEVKLYTFQNENSARLQDGEIQIKENETFKTIGTFKDNKNSVISIAFIPTTGDFIRIKIDKIDLPANSSGVLSEIEIYGNYL